MTTYVWWVRGREFAELAQLSIAAVKRVDRFATGRRLIVCTDEENAEWASDLPTGVQLIRLPGGRPAMVANIEAQIAALMAVPDGEPVLFLDADVVMQQPFPFGDHDLYVTWRPDVNGNIEIAEQMPINYGVLGVVKSQRILEAFWWLKQRVLKMSPMHQDWYGNQLAIADLVGDCRSTFGEKVTLTRWSMSDPGTPLSVRLLPCSTFNYTPETSGEDVADKVALHFKGNRKDMMRAYSEAA